MKTQADSYVSKTKYYQANLTTNEKLLYASIYNLTHALDTQDVDPHQTIIDNKQFESIMVNDFKDPRQQAQFIKISTYYREI